MGNAPSHPTTHFQPPIAVGPITVTTGANSVLFSPIFNGSASVIQTFTLTNNTNPLSPLQLGTYDSSCCMGSYSTVVIPGGGSIITVAASTSAAGGYISSSSIASNGACITTYIDGSGNTATIVILDAAATALIMPPYDVKHLTKNIPHSQTRPCLSGGASFLSLNCFPQSCSIVLVSMAA